MGALEITRRHGRALSPSGRPAPGAPDWIGSVDNPYLHGLFAPVTTEISATALEIEGTLPPDLHGAYFRNGPNPRFAPSNRYHWFDGDGMVHGLWFEDGRAHYRNRYIRTAGLTKERAAGRSLWPGVLGPFEDALGPAKDTANTDLVAYDGRLCALWYESGQLYALDLRTLETVGGLETVGIEGAGVTLPRRISAHSKVDPQTGDFVFFAYGDVPPYMQYGVVPADGGPIHMVDITLPGPRRPHDIGLTTHHAILHDFPVFWTDDVLARTGKRVPLFHPEVPTRLGVIPRRGHDRDVRWFEFAPCYALHTVNCWEEGDWIVMIGCRTADPSLKPDRRDGPLAAMLSGLKLRANLYAWRMNLVTGETREGDLDDLNAEFPTIAPAMTGQQSRYSYHAVIPHAIPATFEGLVRYDLEGGSLQRYDYGPGVFGSEAPFAPRPSPTAEDDGYVITFVTDVRDWSSAALVFDAAAIAEGPVARVILPQRVPAGFHATWVPGDSPGASS